MALFRRSKSPFAYEIDRFHVPQPQPEFPLVPKREKSTEELPPIRKRGWFTRNRRIEVPAEAKDEPAQKPVAATEPDKAKEVPSPAKRKWFGRERPARLTLPGDKPAEKQAAEAQPANKAQAARHPHKPKWAGAAKSVVAPPKSERPAQKVIRIQPQETRRRWFERRKHKGSSEAAKEGTRSSDLMIAALGITLGLICALFPWYIFLNQDKFAAPAVTFEGGGPITNPGATGSLAQRVGAPMNIADMPTLQLDLLATGTLPDEKDGQGGQHPPSLAEQPFPSETAQFKLVHVANGRAMIEDDAGLWIVQVGSTLPDSSEVQSIEKRDGKWVLVTSGDRIVELTP